MYPKDSVSWKNLEQQIRTLERGDIVFCPVGGEHYSSDVHICPKHGVETRVLGQATDSQRSSN